MMFFSALSIAVAASPKENEVKAVLLFHLTRFATWPPSVLTNQTAFTIGVLGPDPFGGALEAVVQGEKVGNLPIVLKRGTTAAALRDCRIVYISPEARESDAKIFETFGSAPLLTVGESSDFIANGGMIRFKRTIDRKIRLEIQLRRVRDRDLNVSAQLLRVSEVLEGGPAR